MLQKGNIGTLQKGNQEYWSDEKRQAHSLKSETGGGWKVGRMTGVTLADHTLKGEAAGNNGALISQAAKDKHELLLMVANGVAGDTEKWTCEAFRDGNAVHYRFRTNKLETGQEPILGVRKFAQFVLDDANGFVQDLLTQEGAEALRTLTDKKRKAHKQATRRKKRQTAALVGAGRGERSFIDIQEVTEGQKAQHPVGRRKGCSEQT